MQRRRITKTPRRSSRHPEPSLLTVPATPVAHTGDVVAVLDHINEILEAA